MSHNLQVLAKHCILIFKWYQMSWDIGMAYSNQRFWVSIDHLSLIYKKKININSLNLSK